MARKPLTELSTAEIDRIILEYYSEGVKAEGVRMTAINESNRTSAEIYKAQVEAEKTRATILAEVERLIMEA